MRCIGKKGASEQNQLKKAKEIEELLKKERKELESKVKLLLLGTGDSGKSTFLKQTSDEDAPQRRLQLARGHPVQNRAAGEPLDVHAEDPHERPGVCPQEAEGGQEGGAGGWLAGDVRGEH